MARPNSNRQRALDIVKGWEHRFGKIGSGRNALLRDIEWALRNTEDRAWEGGSMQAKYRQKAEIEAAYENGVKAGLKGGKCCLKREALCPVHGGLPGVIRQVLG